MSKIVPKLNLNKTPQTVENNSLVYAKNIKVLHDGSVVPDGSYDEILDDFAIQNALDGYNIQYLGNVVGLENKIYFFIGYTAINNNNEVGNTVTPIGPIDDVFEQVGGNQNNTQELPVLDSYSIVEYDEINKTCTRVNSNWAWSGGRITGVVTTNATGKKILTVCEEAEGVPIKHIPIGEATDEDNESLYTRTPDIPFIQLTSPRENDKTVRSGVYQFFVRYKTKFNTYTNWFPASNELYTGNIKREPTIQGSVSHCVLEDNSFGFDFDVDCLDTDALENYTKYEIGCIISTDGASVARLWKAFDIPKPDTNNKIPFGSISFGYTSGELEEVNIDEMLETPYEITNVGNIACLDNRLYIANYDESVSDADFVNDDTDANALQVQLKGKVENSTSDSTSIDYNIVVTPREEVGSIYRYYSRVVKTHTEYDTDAQPIITEECTGFEYEAVMLDLSEDKNGKHNIDWGDYNKIVSWDKALSDKIIKEDDFYYQEHRVNVIQEYGKNQEKAPYGVFEINAPNTEAIFGAYCVELETNEQIYFLLKPNGAKFDIHTEHKTLPALRKAMYVDLFSNDSNQKCVIRKDYDDVYDIANSKVIYNISDSEKTKSGIIIPHGGKTFLLREITFMMVLEWARNTDRTNKASKIQYTSKNNNYYTADAPAESETYTFSVIHSVQYFSITYETKGYSVNINDYLNNRTLLPRVNYDFYIHFVKPNGVATKGYKINKYQKSFGGHSNHNWIYSNVNQIYPIISCKSNINIAKYKYFFISVNNTKTTRFLDVVQDDAAKNHYYSIETNALLDTNVNDFTDNNGNRGVLESGYSIEHFGAIDTIKYSNNLTKHKYIVNNVDGKDDTLVRISPYYSIDKINGGRIDGDTWNLPGFIAYNEVPSFALTRLYYVAGTEVNVLSNNKVEEVTTPLRNTFSMPIIHYSKWNTTFLNVVGGLNKNQFKNWTESSEYSSSYIKTVINTINSQEVSTFLQLDNTYRDFISPVYTKYNSKEPEYSRFDCVVRRSDVYSLENKYFSYKFHTEDYYVIPNNKGNIVYLFQSAGQLCVHLEETLVKFDVKKLISADSEGLSLEEGDAFKQGVTYVKDSNNGYAGLSSKLDTLVTPDIYMFFDKDVNRIYIYDGSKLEDISAPIIKLLSLVRPEHVLFAYDNNVNRIFINMMKNHVAANDTENDSETDGVKNITISFSLVAGGFVSIHDICYYETIHTRCATYLRSKGGTNGFDWYKITEKKTAGFDGGSLYRKSAYLNVNDEPDNNGAGNKYSVLDVICNVDYEKIKVLNWISWVCSSIKKYDNKDNDIPKTIWKPLNEIVLSEEVQELYCGNQIRIYSDQTYSPLLTLTNDSQDAYGTENKSMGGYQADSTENEVFPRNNNGIWTLNDFRDIRQIGEVSPTTSNTDNSLIHGKYIVVRFIFKGNYFKLENVIFNITDYEKV